MGRTAPVILGVGTRGDATGRHVPRHWRHHDAVGERKLGRAKGFEQDGRIGHWNSREYGFASYLGDARRASSALSACKEKPVGGIRPYWPNRRTDPFSPANSTPLAGVRPTEIAPSKAAATALSSRISSRPQLSRGERRS